MPSKPPIVPPLAQYGHWTIINPSVRINPKVMGSLCRCKCGKERVVSCGALVTGRSKSCLRCSVRDKNPNHKHGHARAGHHTDLFEIWQGIKKRCMNPNCRAYRLYGGRGITMHDPWIHSFQAFMETVGPRPSKQHSIDRIDNNGHYEPGNVRWADRTQQARNRRNVRTFDFRGQQRFLTDIAKEHGVNYYVLYGRVVKGGWDIERAISHT